MGIDIESIKNPHLRDKLLRQRLEARSGKSMPPVAVPPVTPKPPVEPASTSLSTIINPPPVKSTEIFFICSKCETPLKAEQFSTCQGRRHSACKSCRAIQAKAYRDANPKHWKTVVNRYLENNPERAKALATARENRRRERQPGRSTVYVQSWRAKNPEKNKENHRLAAHKRRALLTAAYGEFAQDDIIAQYETQCGLCFWCETPLDNGFHIDHFIPLSRGGNNSPENIVCSCQTCNLSRQDSLPPEWRPSDYTAKTAIIACIPCPKPRMTRSDVWKKRPAVLKYRTYCDLLREKFGKVPLKAYGLHLIAHLPMPSSWSTKKKAQFAGMPHRQKPDFDNLLKAVADALFKDDSGIWKGSSEKFWCHEGDEKIEITVLAEGVL